MLTLLSPIPIRPSSRSKGPEKSLKLRQNAKLFSLGVINILVGEVFGVNVAVTD